MDAHAGVTVKCGFCCAKEVAGGGECDENNWENQSAVDSHYLQLLCSIKSL